MILTPLDHSNARKWTGQLTSSTRCWIVGVLQPRRFFSNSITSLTCLCSKLIRKFVTYMSNNNVTSKQIPAWKRKRNRTKCTEVKVNLNSLKNWSTTNYKKKNYAFKTSSQHQYLWSMLTISHNSKFNTKSGPERLPSVALVTQSTAVTLAMLSLETLQKLNRSDTSQNP